MWIWVFKIHNTISLKNVSILQVITWMIFGDVHVSKQDIALTTNKHLSGSLPYFYGYGQFRWMNKTA